MKRCNTCEKELSSESFYPRSAKCKECAKAAARANRLAKLEYYREYDRLRGRTEDRKKKVRERQKDGVGKENHLAATREWAKSNKLKRQCQWAVYNAVRDGRLMKQPCFVCGNEDVEAHHPYYDLEHPLDVVWLCVDHHKECHRKYK